MLSFESVKLVGEVSKLVVFSWISLRANGKVRNIHLLEMKVLYALQRSPAIRVGFRSVALL